MIGSFTRHDLQSFIRLSGTTRALDPAINFKFSPEDIFKIVSFFFFSFHCKASLAHSYIVHGQLKHLNIFAPFSSLILSQTCDQSTSWLLLLLLQKITVKSSLPLANGDRGKGSTFWSWAWWPCSLRYPVWSSSSWLLQLIIGVLCLDRRVNFPVHWLWR